MLAVGIDLEPDQAVRDYELEQGQFFQKKYEVLLESGFAHSWAWAWATK